MRAVLLSLMLLAVPALAETPEFFRTRALAEQGVPDAQFNLGLM